MVLLVLTETWRPNGEVGFSMVIVWDLIRMQWRSRIRYCNGDRKLVDLYLGEGCDLCTYGCTRCFQVTGWVEILELLYQTNWLCGYLKFVWWKKVLWFMQFQASKPRIRNWYRIILSRFRLKSLHVVVCERENELLLVTADFSRIDWDSTYASSEYDLHRKSMINS